MLTIDHEICNRCGLCQKECPMQAILLEEETYRIDPDICTECGYCSDICPAEAIRGGTPQENAAVTLDVLQGRPGPARDLVLLNAAGALVAADLAEDLREGLALAARAVDAGAAYEKLEALRAMTRAAQA